MIDKKQLRDLVETTLKEIDLYSVDAVNLVLGTIAQESAGGEFIRQLNNGPALGICQMEPATFKDHLTHYLPFRTELVNKIYDVLKVSELNKDMLEYNLKFSIIMCRVHYRRKPDALPNTLQGYAEYWKKHYNTYLGAGTAEEFVKHYKKYVL